MYFRRHGLFDARVPRYTSYPPANRFHPIDGPGPMADWLADVPAQSALSFYVHVPFCRRLCWFCACRTQGCKTDAPVTRYLAHLEREMAMVATALPDSVRAERLHIGGGTPTILTPNQTRAFGAGFSQLFPLTDATEFSVEIDPTDCDRPRLEAWAEIGMTRASLGVQDFDEKVQAAIGRQQSLAQTVLALHDLRDLGVKNINLDILYGLPHQTEATLSATIDKVLSLAPDRIAAFGYAHVPWMSKRQNLIPETALPDPVARLRLFDLLARRLTQEGYIQIGIDHFSLPDDGLAKALAERRLHRNFQGYTDDANRWMIGMGASAISRFPQGYLHNATSTSAWQSHVSEGKPATARGIEMTPQEHLTASLIEGLMCYGRVDLDQLTEKFGILAEQAAPRLTTLAERFAPLVTFSGQYLHVDRAAMPLMRIIAAALDLERSDPGAHACAV